MKMSKMKVEFIDAMGDDLTVVNAARVSFDKESDYERVQDGWLDNEPTFSCVISERDQKLIRYLATHKHWSPFSHCFLQFRVKAPIFVARQLAKHQVGLSWNEVSRRYVDAEPEFFEPEWWRGRAANSKQGSSGAIYNDLPDEILEATNSSALHDYQRLLELGVAPEQARMILPQSTMTEWVWSGSLYAFARVCQQRLDFHSQAETADIAAQIDDHCSEQCPISWEALTSSIGERNAD